MVDGSVFLKDSLYLLRNIKHSISLLAHELNLQGRQPDSSIEQLFIWSPLILHLGLYVAIVKFMGSHSMFSPNIVLFTVKSIAIRHFIQLLREGSYVWVCSNPRYSWVTYYILSSICNFSQLVLSILSNHPLFALSIDVTLWIFRRLIKLLSSSRPLLSIHFFRYHLTL